MEKKYGDKLFLAFLICSLLLLIKLFWAYFSVIVLALLISSVFYPMYSRVKHLFRGREQAASFFMILLIFLILVIPVGWFVGTLSNEAFDLYNRTSDHVSLEQVKHILENNPVWAERFQKLGKITGLDITPDAIEQFVSTVGKKLGLFLYSQLSAVASNLFSLVVNFFLMIFAMYCFFRDGQRLKDYVFQLLPIPDEQIKKLADKFQEMGKAIIVGNSLSGIIQGIFGGLGFFLFGLGSPFLWGTVISFMAFLPIIGASAVFIPAAAIVMLQGKVGLGVAFLLYNLLYSSAVEYLIKPRMIGQGMKMSSILVFIGILGGLRLFGILGIIYGPLIITIFLTLAEIYRLEYKEKLA